MWRAQGSDAEADPAGLGLAELDVRQGAGRHEDLAALVVAEDDGLGLGVGHGGQHLLLRVGGLQGELAAGVLDSDRDLHGAPSHRLCAVLSGTAPIGERGVNLARS